MGKLSGDDLARAFTDHERHEIGAMLALKEDATGPRCRPIGNWLVAMAQRAWPRFAGVRFWKKTNSNRAWVLVSYHHPARLCWSWSIWITLFRDFGGNGLRRFWSSYNGNWNLRIPFVVEIGWHRQSYDWMLSDNGKRRLEAAALYRRCVEPEVWRRQA